MMARPRVAYGCVSNSLDRVERYVLPRVGDRDLTVLWNQTSLTRAYNFILNAYMWEDVDMLVLLHDDLEIIDPDAETKLLTALTQRDVALVGVAGGVCRGTLAWWNGITVGHQLTDSGMLDFGPRSGDVDLLEGSLLAFGHRTVKDLRFDERFTGFHGYDEIAAQARSRGWRVHVADVDTHHHTVLGFESTESEAAWLKADERYRKKWS